MKNKFLCLTFLFYAYFINSQNLFLKNAISIEGGSNVQSKNVVIDNLNNKYIAGTLQGTADFNPSENENNLTSNGGVDIFLAKYDENGNYLWAFNFGGFSTSGFFYDFFGDIIIDNSGNIYITGEITSDCDLDPSANEEIVEAGIFLAKYNSNGEYLWAFNINGSSTAQAGRSLAVDSSNNIYMAGVFANSNGDFDPSNNNDVFLQSNGSNDFFVSKYDTNGNYQWAFNIGNTNSLSSQIDIKIDNNQDLYVSSSFIGNIDFDPSENESKLDSGDDYNFFLAKYTNNGAYLWSVNLDTKDDVNSGVNGNYISEIEIDNQDNVYLTGGMVLPIDFDPSVNDVIEDADNTNKKSFLSKYGADGTFKWVNTFANARNSMSNGLKIDNQNNIYLTGYANYTSDFDPTNNTDNLVSGSTLQNLYVTKYNENGNYQWANTVQVDSGNTSQGESVVINNDGSTISITGSYKGTVDFDLSVGQKLLTSYNNYFKGFIATYFLEEPVTYSITNTNFEQALIDLGFDTNGLNGNILEADANKIETLQISNPENNSGLPNVNAKITDVSGIENFINLKNLYCSNNNITNLDLSNNEKLTYVNCKNNNLQSLNLKNGNNLNMNNIDATGNVNLTCIQVDSQLSSLDKWFFIDEQTGFSEDCSQNDAISNYFTTVPDSEFEGYLIEGKIDTILDGKFRTKDAFYIQSFSFGTSRTYNYKNLKGIEAFKNLKEFSSTSYFLEDADFSKNLNLESLNLNSTRIDSLDVSALTKLKTLNCDGGNTYKIKFLNVNGAINLERLSAGNNNFTEIDVSTNTKLTWLGVHDNQLTEIDVANNTALETFGCYDNRIKTLDLSNNANLRLMYAHRNYMEWIDMKVGNSNFVLDFNASANPNLNCVLIDNPTASRVQFFESRVDDNVTVSDSCTLEEPKNFITKWKTTSNNEVVSIIRGAIENYGFDIDWGDGSKSENLGNSVNHIYESPGEYLITMSGNLYEIVMGSKPQLLEVVQWGTNRWRFLQTAFMGSENLQITASDTPDLSLALNLNSMFKDCTSLDYDFGSWDIAETIRMPDMLNQSGLSEENYDKTLLGWSQLTNVPRNIQFGAEGVYYCDNEAIKNKLINDYNWTITDAGRGCGFQTIDIPDSNFEQALIDLGYDTNGLNGNILQSEAEAVQSLNLSNKSITDLTGVDAFLAMITLNVSNNSLTSLDLSENTNLESLNSEANQIATLNLGTNSKMFRLDIENNNITTLDLSNIPNLEILYCGLNTSLSTLNVSNNLKIEWIDCNNTNSLSTLTLGDNDVLRHLDIDGHLLTSLDFSQNENLQTVECSFGNLTSIITNSKLKNLSCTANNISIIDLTNAIDLEEIDIDRNSLTTIDFSQNTKLIRLQISDNNLNSIDLTKNINLETISINKNALIALDLSENIKLETLFSSENTLTNILFGANNNLKYININENNLINIDISGVTNLRALSAFTNDLSSLDIEQNIFLEELSVYDNQIASIDASKNVNLLHFEVKNNNLTYLNYKNGNNTAITIEPGSTKVNRLFDVSNNPNLKCIEVDDVNHANTHFTKDVNARFKTDCIPKPFITKWKTTSTNESITIPVSSNQVNLGNYDYTVDWGDGIIDSDITNGASHTYSNAGDYLVKISGDFPMILMNNSSDKEKLYEITQWGSIVWSFMSFNGCSNLQITASDAPDLFNVTSFTSMFKNCTTLNANINHWDVSNITNMNNLFEGATSFNQALNNWDVSGVSGTSMHNVFKNATSFNQPLNNWDVSNVFNISRMFLNASSFNGALNDWNTVKLEFVFNTFDSATSFNQPLNNWDVSGIDTFSNLFNNATSLNQSLNEWDVSNATSFNNMFRGATKFNQPLNNWDITNVTIMVDMFSNTSMSVINYDKTLIGWATLPNLQTRVHLDANLSNYCNSETARNLLITSFIWDIDDAGKDCSTIDSPTNVNGMWNDPTNWASGVVPTSTDNVVIPIGTTLQISDDISEINSLENEGTIVINPTYSLKSKSNMVNNGTIVMNSDTDDSSVLFVVGTSNGNVTYTRGGLLANKWSLVTPPVSRQKIKEFAVNANNDIRVNATVDPKRYAIGYYNDANADGNKWSYYTENVDVNSTFTAGESYAISRATNGAVTFTGTLTTDNATKTLKPGEWNAIGNPFTTYYPANKNSSSSFLNDNYAILDDNFKGLYVWDNAQNKYVVVSEMDLQDRSFTPGQGFFIKVKPDATKIEFKEAKRSIKPATGTTVFNKTVNKYIRLLANDGTYTVSTDIKFLNNATNGFDIGLDIGNFSSSSFDFYTHLVDNSNTKNYTIQSIPFENQHEYIIPLGITAKDSDVVLSSLHNNLPVNSTLVIEDRKNNTFTDITDENSSFKITIGTSENTKDRFYLHVSTSSALSLDNSSLDGIQIYAANKILFIKGVKEKASIEIFNILGQSVYKTSLSKDQNINLPLSVKQGVYNVKLSISDKMKTKMIVIN